MAAIISPETTATLEEAAAKETILAGLRKAVDIFNPEPPPAPTPSAGAAASTYYQPAIPTRIVPTPAAPLSSTTTLALYGAAFAIAAVLIWKS